MQLSKNQGLIFALFDLGVFTPGSEFTNILTLNPLSDDKILDWSKLKQIADDILKCI